MLFKKIDVQSPDSVSTGLDFFSFPCTNVSLSKSVYKEFLPLNPSKDPPLHFKLPAVSSFMDFKHMYIKTEWQAMKQAAADQRPVNIVAADNVSVINCLGASFIRSMKVFMNGREIYNSNGYQAYKNIIDYELNYSKEAKESHLGMAGYYLDGENQNAMDGPGFEARKALFTNGKIAEFIAKIDADPFNIEKYFINNVEIEIEIHPHDTKFLLLAPNVPQGTNVTLELKHAKLYVMYHDLTDGLSLSLAKRIEREPVKYDVRRSELKSIYLEPGRNEINANLFLDQIPRKIVIAMVDRDDFDGNRGTSPFNFKHNHLREIRIDWNGMSNPNVAYDLDFENYSFARPYFDMQQSCGYAFSPLSNGITMKMFRAGWTILVFNLTTNLEDEKCFELIRQGTTSLHARFSQAIPAGGVNMLIYAEFDQLMMIDKNRTVTTDLTA